MTSHRRQGRARYAPKGRRLVGALLTAAVLLFLVVAIIQSWVPLWVAWVVAVLLNLLSSERRHVVRRLWRRMIAGRPAESLVTRR